MNTSKEYKRWYYRNFEGLRSRYVELRDDAGIDHQRRRDAERKRLKLKSKRGVPATLPVESSKRIREETLAVWEPIVSEAASILQSALDLRDAKLRELSAGVEFTPDQNCWYLITSSTSSAFSTQGFGAERYARHAFCFLEHLLSVKGFEVYVREIVRDYPKQSGGYGYSATRNVTYELWSNCPKWMSEPISGTLVDFVRICNQNGVNPRVYNPFLPYELTN